MFSTHIACHMQCLIKSKHEDFKFKDLWNTFWKFFPRNYDSKMTHFIMMFQSYKISFYVLGKIMNYGFNNVAPTTFYDNILVASDYFRVFRTCGLWLLRSELHLWPPTISEWAAPLHLLCGDTLNVHDWKLWLEQVLWT